MATSTIFSFNFNNSEIVDSTGQWYNATTGTPTTEFIEHDGNTALLQRAYIAGTAYTRDINPVFFQSRDPTFTAHTYTIELQIYPLRDSGGFGPWDGPVLEFNTESDEEGWVSLVSVQRASKSNTFYWHEYDLGPDDTGIPFLTVTAADGTYNRWYSIRIERVDDGTNTGATIKIYVDGTLVVNETLTYSQDARRGRIGNSIRYTYRQNSRSPEGAGAAIDNFKLTAGIAPSSVVDVSLANLQRNNANLLSFIKGKVPTVNDGTLTIQQNGTNVATFTANASTNATANITVPTKTSDLNNDSGFITSDNTKIPLAGSNQISGSLIPATTDAYDLGGTSYQWNNAYIKSLTINGAACGDILTHNVSEFVDVTSAQTIGGNKEFTDLQTIRYGTRYKGNRDAYILPEFSAGYSGLSITTLGFLQTLRIGNFALDNNNKPVLDTSKAYIQVATGENNNVNTCLMEPRNSASSSLGTSTNKWKSFNGINPGALSLPGDAYIDIDTTNYAWGSNFTFTPDYDGYCFIGLGSSSNSKKISLKTGRGEYYFSNQTDIFRFTFPVYKGKLVTILTNSSGTESVIPTIRLSPCQGNV